MDGLSVKNLKTHDRYNVVIKDRTIYATVNGFEFEMTIDDYEKFTRMVSKALAVNLHAAYIDEAGDIHAISN